MSEVAIRVENLGKKYRIGAPAAFDLRNAFGQFIKRINPFSNNQGTGSHQDFWALKEINFEIKKGEAVGIIGRNGAGKSTLLKILSRITEPTTGFFNLTGRVSSLLEVGTGFHMELTGRENIFLNGTILGMKRREIREKFDEILDFSGIEQFIDTPVKHYSSGMKVRLAFSVAAHLEPEILIIDEVLAVGDAEFQKKCLGKMEDVTGQGRTVLFVSHNLGAVKNLCESCIYLDKGLMVKYGKSIDLINTYLSGSENHSSGFKKVADPFYGKMRLLNERGEDINELYTGQMLRILIEYNPEITPYEKLNQIIQFRNDSGNILFSCNNYHTIGSFSGNKINGGLICTIPKLPLNEGNYYISLFLREGTRNVSSLEDRFKIKVNKGDFYGSGKLPRPSYGMLVDHYWDVVDK
jgi:lipopolysaccharide transport system ATP-binding protein